MVKSIKKNIISSHIYLTVCLKKNQTSHVSILGKFKKNLNQQADSSTESFLAKVSTHPEPLSALTVKSLVVP